MWQDALEAATERKPSFVSPYSDTLCQFPKMALTIMARVPSSRHCPGLPGPPDARDPMLTSVSNPEVMDLHSGPKPPLFHHAGFLVEMLI